MYPKDRQKMCTSCDGRIPIDAAMCPYCTAQQMSVPSSAGSAKELHHQSLQDSLTSLYTPPYAGKTAGFTPAGGAKMEIPPIPQSTPLKASMVEKRVGGSSAVLGVPSIPTDSAENPHVDEARNHFWPILLLSVAANLLTVGLLQLFFSDEGFLRLEWDSSHWYIYCLAAFPLFF